VSRFGVALFERLQGMPFYRDAHQQAVDTVATPAPARWIDVGTGPGMLARLAAARGHDVLGLDPDRQMIQAARRADPQSAARYLQGGVDDLDRHGPADVVSATSLLCVVPDPRAAVDHLWNAVADHGALLVVETTDQMRPGAGKAVPGLSRTEQMMLGLWARARSGRTLDRRHLHALPAARITTNRLLGGLLEASVLHKEPAP
jgi:2-polyprenyl-3-methyl-5-hydroxy-6-metoxy-1,4-benzoquinol methylase